MKNEASIIPQLSGNDFKGNKIKDSYSIASVLGAGIYVK